MNRLVADTRLALRTWRRTPGFTAVAVISIALGIGANAAIVGPGAERAIVFQSPCLLPWLTARDNVRLAAEAAKELGHLRASSRPRCRFTVFSSSAIPPPERPVQGRCRDLSPILDVSGGLTTAGALGAPYKSYAF